MTSAIPPAMLDGVRRMNGTRRFLTLTGLVAALAAIWAMTQYAQAPSMVTLYRGLELREAASMADALQKGGIRYELTSGGSEITVPIADVARARVAIAKEGIRADGEKPGNELYDSPTWGKTDREMAVLERRALEGELARTLEQIHGIERASVHLGLPESSPLRKLDRPAKASVVLSVRGAGSLTSEQVASITYLVANAVPALSPDQVALLDSDGRLLSAPNDGSVGGLSSRQLEMQHKVEDYLARNAERMLATALGSGEAQVQVNAKLNFEQVDKTVETYNPDGAVLQNEQRSETTGADSLSGGNATVVNNTYLNSRVVEKVAGSVGGIERLTVAVLVNEAAIGKAAGAGANVQTEIARYEQVVRDAIGMDSTRGDRITVSAVKFDSTVAVMDSLPQGGGGGEKVLVVVERFSRPIIGILGILAALILALRVLKPGPAPSGGGGQFGATQEPASFERSGTDTREPELPPVKVPALNAAATRLKNEVQAESSQRPEMAASVVKAWLSEGG